MQSRFLIRTRNGQEMAPKTLDAFSDMVRSGVIHHDDLVFDALTGLWAPAGTHPMVLLFQDLEANDPLPAAAPDDDLGLALTEATRATPEEEEAAFIRRMDEERGQDPEIALAQELTLVDPRPSPVATPSPTAPVERGPAGRAEPRAVSLPAVVQAVPRDPPRRARAPYRRGLVGTGVAAALTVAAVLSVWKPGAVPGPRASGPMATVEAAAFGTATRQPGPTAPAVRVLTATEEEVRSYARQRFEQAVARVGGKAGLGAAPEAWLEGRYLADPETYPEIPRYWSRVRTFVEEVRRQEEDLYREAYLAAAAELGVRGPVRSLRMATALEDFTVEAPRREAHYEEVRELARASLALHELLLELKGRVTYEPIRGRRVSADPVLEAAGTDAEAQSLLEVALDRVLSALPGSEGLPTRDRSHLTEWMVEGVAR